MSISALPELLFSWVKNQSAELLKGQTPQTSPFTAGTNYEGKVLDLLPSGRQLVQVGDQKLDMALPGGARPGDSVRLTFVSGGVRPTFLLDASAAQPARQVELSSTAQQVNTLMRMTPAPAQSVTQLPPPATTMTAPLAGQAAVQGASPNSAAVSGAAAPPLAPVTAPAVSDLAKALPQAAATAQSLPLGAAAARTIVANVVMLQNHVAALPGTPAAVASANTALLGQPVDAVRAASSSRTTLAPTVVAETAPPSASLLPEKLTQTLRQSGLFYESHLASWTRGGYSFEALLKEPQARLGHTENRQLSLPGLPDMPEEVAQIAGRQLHMLEGAPLLWQGYAWPGQWMDWMVRERQDWHEGGHEGEAADQWESELRLILPRMGTVVAQLSLRGQGIRLNLRAADPATAQTLASALPELRQGFEAAGLEILALKVEAGIPPAEGEA